MEFLEELMELKSLEMRNIYYLVKTQNYQVEKAIQLFNESASKNNEAVEWRKAQQELIEKKERARKLILDDLLPMLEEKQRLRAEQVK